ncbi:hypothetical protein D3C75_1182070 [compost metagenome]
MEHLAQVQVAEQRCSIALSRDNAGEQCSSGLVVATFGIDVAIPGIVGPCAIRLFAISANGIDVQVPQERVVLHHLKCTNIGIPGRDTVILRQHDAE